MMIWWTMINMKMDKHQMFPLKLYMPKMWQSRIPTQHYLCFEMTLFCCLSRWQRGHLSLSLTCLIFHLTKDLNLKASGHKFTSLQSRRPDWTRRETEWRSLCSFRSLNWPSASALFRPLTANCWACTMTSGMFQKPRVPIIRLSVYFHTNWLS